MTRTTVHPDVLTFAIREAMALEPCCRNCVSGEVRQRLPDADGCNWTLSFLNGSGSGDCLVALLPSLERLKRRFAVSIGADAQRSIDLAALLCRTPGDPCDE